MTRWIVRRLLAAIPLVLGIATVVFLVVHLAPGDYASYILRPGIPPEVADQLRINFGLDQPLHVRYLKWLAALFTGDLGYSLHYGMPVAAVLADVLPNTLLLSGVALVGSFLVGVAVGVIQAVRHGTFVDGALSVVSLVFYSMPSFWLAVMLVLVFAVNAATVWDWPIHFPVSGARSVAVWPDLSPSARILDRLWHLVLPATTLILVTSAGIARFTRAGMLEALSQDFVRTARARGLSERRVVLGHALRNALLPVVTLFGLALPILFSGTVLVEVVFQWPGMGSTVVNAIGPRDYPVVMAGSVLFAVIVVLGNLLSDILYALVDPRIRHG